MTLDALLQDGLRCHRAGNLANAERLYREVLAHDPAAADAVHLLGVISHQLGRNAMAVDIIQRAIQLRPNVPEYLNNLGQALQALGRQQEALSAYDRAIALGTGFAEAHNNRGNALRALARPDDAAAAYGVALKLRPAYAEARSNLAAIHQQQGRLDEAIAGYRLALQLNPQLVRAHVNLGNALRSAARWDDALAAYRAATAADPNAAEPHEKAGDVLHQLGRLDEAIAEFETAVSLESDNVDPQLKLMAALLDAGKTGRALDACQCAAIAEPARFDVQNALGAALGADGQVEDAIAAYRRAVELKPDFAEAHNNIALALRKLGRLDDAIASFRRAIAHRPDYVEAHSALLFTLLLNPGWTPARILDEHMHWARTHAAPLAPAERPKQGRRSRSHLRIGFVSADLRDHAVGRNILPLFLHRDGSRFEFVVYSNARQPDAMTAQFRERTDIWNDISDQSDEAVAELVRQQEIDVLVDLNLHTNGHRLLVFARRPAPVQITFAGYPGTTGLDTIDYRLTDPYLDPPGEHDSFSTERLLRLPQSFWCFDPLGERLDLEPREKSHRRSMKWACLGNPDKINGSVLRLWGSILQATPESRLRLLAPEGSIRKRLLAGLAGHGIAAGRIEFVPPQPRRKYLEAHHGCDIILDTFPYNGHTTTCDALWMGVPVVSLAGETPVSRAGLSLLTNVGVPELVARSPEAYVRIAVALAQDDTRLRRYQATLRGRMEASPVMNAIEWTRGIEAAFVRCHAHAAQFEVSPA